MQQHDSLTAFVDRLARAETRADAFNQYAYGNVYNDIRRANLQRYLDQMTVLAPTLMLVMEAPGYRGMRLTGVPVASRKLLTRGVPQLGLFGVDNGYRDVDEPGFERVNGEASATAVWGTLAAHGTAALVWNAYPFHPHQPDLPLTNRKPRRAETETGSAFLRDMLDLFKCQTIVAVGNVADESLSRMGISHLKVRHPAQGGKTAFVTGLTAILDSR